MQIIRTNETFKFNDLSIKLLSANSTEWSNTFKQFVGKLPANCLRVFDHFVALLLEGLRKCSSLNFASILSEFE